MGMSSLSMFEGNYECGGYCTKQTMYSYRDMATYGSPKEACVKSVYNSMRSSYLGMGVVFALTAVTCLLMLMASACLYCHRVGSEGSMM